MGLCLGIGETVCTREEVSLDAQKEVDERFIEDNNERKRVS